MRQTCYAMPTCFVIADGCENKKCDHYSICESDGSGAAKCVCPEACVDVSYILFN